MSHSQFINLKPQHRRSDLHLVINRCKTTEILMLYIGGPAQILNRYPFYMDEVLVLENTPDLLNILDSNQKYEN